MPTIKQCCALCLVVLLLLTPIAYLFDTVSNTDDKIDWLQQNHILEYEKTLTEIENVLDNIMTKIETMLQDHENYVIIAILIDSQSQTEADDSTKEDRPHETLPNEGQSSPEQQDKNDNHYENYYGRLCIPDALIDVALYYGADQEICNREDSANIFSMSVFDGLYISDHNNQEFSKLFNVTVGMRGYLQRADGTVFNIVCTDMFTGNNTGKYIVDENGNTNLDADFIMYTCSNGWQNILICLWKHC